MLKVKAHNLLHSLAKLSNLNFHPWLLSDHAVNNRTTLSVFSGKTLLFRVQSSPDTLSPMSHKVILLQEKLFQFLQATNSTPPTT
jgi:hypothetical protein